MTLRSAAASFAALASLALVGCGPKLASMKVEPATATMQAVNETTRLRTAQLDADGKPLKKAATVTWTSSDPAVVTIAADGLATAHKSGSITVTAKVDKIEGKGTLEVHIPTKIATQDLTFAGFGQTQTISLQVLDEGGKAIDAATAKMTLTLSSGSSVSIDGPIGGPWTLKSIAAGKSKLTATSGPLSQDFVATVTPPEVTGLKIEPLSLRLKIGETQKINATALSGSEPIAGLTATFTSSSQEVVTVDSDGVAKGTGKGKATISVVAGGKQGTVNVTVKK